MTSEFSTALEGRDLAALRRCPKADLHIHGIGGGDREFIPDATGVDLAPVERTLRSMAQMHAFADEKLASLFSGSAGRALAFHATFVQAHKDGVTRLEVGEDAWAITLDEGSAQAVWTMLSGAHRSEAPNID
jgi:adenosine deaminase